MHRNRLLLALVLSVGCAAPAEQAPPSFDPAAPFPTYRATGGWVTGELDGTPFTAVGIDAYANPDQRFPDCSTQTLTFTMDAPGDGHREVSVFAEMRFSEIDGLRAGAPVLVGTFWDWVIRYRDPPWGGALLDITVDMDDQTYWGVQNGEPIEARLVDVCDPHDGACHVRMEIDGHFTFEGANELARERHDGILSIAVDLEREMLTPDNELGWPTLVETGSCPPPGGDGALRLAGDRLEILHEGLWGSVCSRGFDADDARVACRQLGYSDGEWSLATPSDLIWMNDLACTGDEARLADCPFDGWGVRDCEDSPVALRCY